MRRVLARSEHVAVFKDSHLTICGDAALSRRGLLRSGVRGGGAGSFEGGGEGRCGVKPVTVI